MYKTIVFLLLFSFSLGCQNWNQKNEQAISDSVANKNNKIEPREDLQESQPISEKKIDLSFSKKEKNISEEFVTNADSSAENVDLLTASKPQSLNDWVEKTEKQDPSQVKTETKENILTSDNFQEEKQLLEKEEVFGQVNLKKQEEQKSLKQDTNLKEQAEQKRLEQEANLKEQAEQKRLKQEANLKKQEEQKSLKQDMNLKEQAEQKRLEQEANLKKQSDSKRLDEVHLKKQAELKRLAQEANLKEQKRLAEEQEKNRFWNSLLAKKGTYKYDLYIKKEKKGTQVTKIYQENGNLIVELNVVIDASTWMYTYKLAQTSTEVWRDGIMLSYTCFQNDNGTKTDLNAKLSSEQKYAVTFNGKTEIISGPVTSGVSWNLMEMYDEYPNFIIIDGGTGKSLPFSKSTRQDLANEVIKVGSSSMNCNHIKGKGKKWEAWYSNGDFVRYVDIVDGYHYDTRLTSIKK